MVTRKRNIDERKTDLGSKQHRSLDWTKILIVVIPSLITGFLGRTGYDYFNPSLSEANAREVIQYIKNNESRSIKNENEIKRVDQHLTAHEGQTDLHMTLEKKLEMFYTRREGEALERNWERIERKLDEALRIRTK